MSDNPKQPRKSDAVLGGSITPPLNAAVLGGIEGVQNRLESSNVEARIGALQEALNYEEAGLEIITQALYNRSGEVRLAAYKILLLSSEPAAQEALAVVNRYQFLQCVNTIQTSDRYVHSVAITPDNKTFVCGGGDRQQKITATPGIWNIEKGKKEFKPSFTHNGTINSVAITPDGEKMISVGTDGNIIICDLTTGKLVSQLKSENLYTVFYSVVVDPNGENFYTSDNTGSIRIWNWNSDKEIARLEGHSRQLFALSISPDGNFLASGGEDRTIRVWDLKNRIEMWSIKNNSHCIMSLAISPDGHTLVSGSDQRIKIWDIYSQKEVLSFYGHADLVRSIVFSPDGKSFITAGDENIKVWDIASGNKIYSFVGNIGTILTLALSSCGQILLSGGVDGNVKIWRF